MIAKKRSARVGLRETKKQERFERIKREARQLFEKNGYDQTTLRMIAKKANLGLATIFRYVRDKRDLLYLLFDADHHAVNDLAVKAAKRHDNFLEQCIGSFRFFYEYFGRNPEFARSVLREAIFYPLEDVNRAYETKARSLERLKVFISDARKRGEIRAKAADEDIATLIFELYQIECRRWLAQPKPTVDAGMKSLRRALEMIYNGLKSE